MFKILFVILKRKKYAFSALVSFLIMAAASYYLTVINVFHNDILIYAQMNGYLFTIFSVVLGLIASILFGLYISLLLFKKDIEIKGGENDKITSFFGTGVNMVASGCPSCGVPLLGLVGAPLGLSILPFGGLELKLLSVGLLWFSTEIIAKNIKSSLACKNQLAN